MHSGNEKQHRVSFTRVRLAAFIALSLGVASVGAQEPVKPGLYTTVDEDEIYLIQGGQQVDVKTGETVMLTADGLEFVDKPPAFLSWPCGTGFAPNQGTLATFPASDLTPGEEIIQVTRAFFDEAKVLEGNPRWLNGESHLSLPIEQIEQFVSNSSWYSAGPPDAKMAAQRPDTLIISIFYGTGQVVVDTNHLEQLKEKYGDQDIPVVFEYQDENIVPISYFGENPTPEMVMQAFQEQGIKPADAPMWYAGDKHMEADPGQLADLAGIPPASEMDPDKLEKIMQDIQANGFSGKPMTMAMTQGGDVPLIDEPERLRAAQMLGINSVPVQFSFYDSGSHAEQCGLSPPVAAAGGLGTVTDNEEASPIDDPSPDESGNGDGPAGDGPAGDGVLDDPLGPDEPQIPPEISLPNPPQPELPPEILPPPPPPASDN